LIVIGAGIIIVSGFMLAQINEQEVEMAQSDQTVAQNETSKKIQENNSEIQINTSSVAKQQPQEPKQQPQQLITKQNQETTRQPWRLASKAEQISTIGDEYVEYIKLDNKDALDVTEGDKLSLLIPQENWIYEGTVEESTKDYGGDVVLSEGTLDAQNEFASFSMAKGVDKTYVMVMTGESIYQIEIDNKTGVGTVMDDRELDKYRQHDDGVAPEAEF